MLSAHSGRAWPAQRRVRMVLAAVLTLTLALTMLPPHVNQASAAEGDLSNAGYGSLHRPSIGHISDQEGVSNGDDRGVATWVGGNMWVGAPREGYADGQFYSRKVLDGQRTQKPEPTYAVEAEGLTLVGNKLVMNMVKGQWRQVTEHDDTSAVIKTFDNSWHRNGFRFGVVGFGGQIRPKSNSTVLSVNGVLTQDAKQYGSKDIRVRDGRDTEDPGYDYIECSTAEGCATNVYAFHETGRGFVDYDQRYYADVRDKFSYPINDGGINPETRLRYPLYSENQSGNPDSSINTNAAIYAVRRAPGEPVAQNVNWNRQNDAMLYPDGASLFSKVYHDGEYLDFSKFQKGTVEKTSDDIANLSNTGEVDSSTKAQTGYVRQKYNYNSGNEHKYKLTLNFDDNHQEKVITFTGDGEEAGPSSTGIGKRHRGGSSIQVFTLDASALDSTGYNGISFAFDRIPEDAVVIVNVVGSQDIDFHNGWRLWWNGEDISNYYVQGDGQTERNALYSHASSAIMWNFADTGKLTIRGGKVTEGQAQWESPNWSGWTSDGGGYRLDDNHPYSIKEYSVTVDDDPAAAMLGSILVPRGTFESHVSTNGRVWVGGDFMMYNPTGLEDLAFKANTDKPGGYGHYEDISASLVCMDQERHNFVWPAEDATALAWNKVNEHGNRIGGTAWGVYNSLAAAKEKTEAEAPVNAEKVEATKDKRVATLTDGGSGDWDSALGSLKTGSLKRNADYYIRELQASPGHELNDRIYRIDTLEAGQNSKIVGVWEKAGDDWKTILDPGTSMDKDVSKYMLKDITPSSASGTPEQVLGIVNRKLPSVEWEKVDAEDHSTRLPGSEWKLQYTPTSPADALTWTMPDITDSISTRIYFNPSKVKWGVVGATYYVKYNTKQKGADGNDIWKEVQLSGDGLATLTDGMLAASIPMSGQSFDFYFLYKVDGTEQGRYYKYDEHNHTTSFTAPSNTGHYYVIDSTVQQSEAPACAYGRASTTDSDPRPGYFKVIGLVPADYLLTETKAPSGYWSPDNNSTVHYGFTVEGQNVTWTDTEFTERTKKSDGTVAEQKILRSLPSNMPWPPYTGSGQLANTPNQVSWWKVDADDKDAEGNVTNTLLTGSAWELQQWTQTSSTTYEYTTMKNNIVDATSTLVYVDLTNMGDSLEYVMNGSTHRASALPDTGCGSIKVFEVPSAGKGFKVYPSGGRFVTVSPGATVVFIQRSGGNGLVSHFYPPACAVSSAPQDEDSTPGKLSLKRLPVGKYRLTETKAPLGYVLPSDEYIYFEVKGTKSETEAVEWKQGWAKVKADGSPENLSPAQAPIAINEVSATDPARVIGNDRKPGEVIWEKVESGTETNPQPNLLSGSEWSLAYTKYGATATDTKPTKTLTIKDCVKETKNGTTTTTYCTVAENGLTGTDDAITYKWAVDMDTTGGKFKISGMPWGDYALTETKAPDGFTLDTTPHEFSIGVKTVNDNAALGTVGAGGTVTEYPTNTVADKQSISIDLGKIGNEPGVILPEVGGEGRQLWPAALGLLCMFAALGCAFAMHSRE